MNEYTKEELISKIKTSDDKENFIMLMKETISEVSNVRNIIMEKGSDSLELRMATIKVLEDLILKPLLDKVKEKKVESFVDYT
jgi:hypothetical protein